MLKSDPKFFWYVTTDCRKFLEQPQLDDKCPIKEFKVSNSDYKIKFKHFDLHTAPNHNRQLSQLSTCPRPDSQHYFKAVETLSNLIKIQIGTISTQTRNLFLIAIYIIVIYNLRHFPFCFFKSF